MSDDVKKYADLRAKAEYFEDGEYIILAAGGMVGGTVSKTEGAVIERWLNERGALPELAHRINKLFGATPEAGPTDVTDGMVALLNSMRLRRNTRISGDVNGHFEGEWIAIPREDFEAQERNRSALLALVTTLPTGQRSGDSQ